MRKLRVLLVLMIISSCSTYSSQFDCPLEDGARCMSLKRVNNMVREVRRGEDEIDFNNHLSN